jgi:hypothetical protein
MADPAVTKPLPTPLLGSKPRRVVYGIEAVRSGRGVDVIFDLGETVIQMSEHMFLLSIQGPSYAIGAGEWDRDVWVNLSGHWKPFFVPEIAWTQYTQTRQKIREEDMAAIALAAATTKEGEIVSEAGE